VTRPLWADLTPGAISKAVLPVIYAGTSLRLLAVRRESQDPAVRDMGVALAATAAALSTLPAAALHTFEELFGDANYGRFLSQLGTVVAAGAGNGVILRSAYEPSEAHPRVRSRRQRMLGTLIIMTVLFCLVPGLMDTIKPRRIKDGSTTEVPGGASGASDQVDVGSAQGLRQSSERVRADR
jgi:hypothetical protein